jgi:hypothetical protein
MEISNIMFLIVMILGAFFSLRKGFRDNDKEGYYSINIRFIIAGFTMLIVSVIMIFR